MKSMFILSVLSYFLILGGMHLLIQAILMISTNVYYGAAITAFIILLFSVLLAYKDRK